jgi:hypothetical protein
MIEIHRSHMCPECGRRFLVTFNSSDAQDDDPTIRVDCPRTPDGAEDERGAPRPRCTGFVMTQVPALHRVLPADN